MSADPKILLTRLVRDALESVAPGHAAFDIQLERPRQAGHGDFATNVAMRLAKTLKRNPRELATLLVAELPASALVGKVEVAGAGFINFTLAAGAKTAAVGAALARGESLEDLAQKSSTISDQSKMFAREAAKMNRCCSIF